MKDNIMINGNLWEDYVSSNTTKENQRFFHYVGEELNNCPHKNGESLDRIFQEWMDNLDQERIERRSKSKNDILNSYK